MCSSDGQAINVLSTASMFFNGVMGSYYGTSNFPGQSAGGGDGGSNAQVNYSRPGSPGYQPPQVPNQARQDSDSKKYGGTG